MVDDKLAHQDPLFTARITYAAFIAGVLIFSVIALVLATPPQPPTPSSSQPAAPASSPLPLIAVGFAALAIVPSFVIRGIMRKRARTEPDTIDPQIATSGVLIQGAILEGAALLGTTVYFITTEPVALIATGLGVLGLALSFPRRNEFLVEEAQRAPAEEQRFGFDA